MQQAVLAGNELDEGTEGLDRDDAAGVLLADLGLLDDELDATTGLFATLVARGDEDRAVLLDVDVGAGLFLDAADDLAARPMTSRILSVRDLDGEDARCELLEVLARHCRSRRACCDMMYARPSLAWRSALARISVDRPLALLSICSAVMPLSVPATLKSMSPRKSSRPWMSVRTATWSPSLMRPMAIPETGALIGTPASMSASVEPQTEPMEDEPLDSSTSDTMRIVYGKSSSSGMTGSECTLSQGAVADVAALGAAHEAGLARAERREVVVVDVALALGHVDRVEALPLGQHARASGPRGPGSGRE